MAGLYFFNQKIVGHPISIYGPTATYWLLPAGRPANLLDGYQTNGTTDFRTDSYAGFGEITWHLAEKLAVTAGARYTYENKDGSYDVQAFGGLTTGLTAALINDKNSILRSQSYTGHLNDGSASGRANLAYQLNSDNMAYASYARGQKSGGINMSGLPVYPAGVAGHASGDPILGTITVRPEQNTSLELGLKQRALGGALRFNINAFHTQVRDFQANVVDNAAVIALSSYLANIPKVIVDGVESDASARVAPSLTLRASGAYASGRYADYANGSCPIKLTGSSTSKCDLSCKGLPGLPRWSGSLGAQYSHGLAGGELLVNADAFGKTRIYGDATNSAYTEISGYALLIASLAIAVTRAGK